MGADVRFRALFRAVLSCTWISVASLALAVVADVLAHAARPAGLLFVVAWLGAAVGGMVCLARVQGKGILGGLISIGISIYAGLVTLLLASSAFLIP